MVLEHRVLEVSSSSSPQAKFEATDHGDSVLAGLKQLREKELLFDVVLSVQGQKFPAHRVVLASCCDYFRAMFTDGLRESTETEIELNGVTATGLKNLIDFAYSSKILLDFENVQDILLSANHVQMLPVITACSDFLTAHLALDNCVDMLNMAELFSMPQLKQIILQFMCSNLTILASCAPFYQKMSFKQFHTLLSSDYPVDCKEVEVMTCVLNWISYHFDKRAQYAASLLSQIHMKNVLKIELSSLPVSSVLERVISLNPSIQRLLSSDHFQSREDTLTDLGLTNERGFKNSIVCIGGFSPTNGMSNELLFYNFKSDAWKQLSTIPHVNQCNFGQAVLGNQLYVVGGCFNDQIQEVVHQYGFCYNPQRGQWKSIAPLRFERCRFYLGALKGKLYAIGGDPLAGDVTENSAHCECYDPEEDKWMEISPLPGNRAQHAGVVFKDHLYISGGLQDMDEDFFTSFYKYDADNDLWTELCPLLTPRADHAMFVYQGQIHCIGGWYENDGLTQRVLVSSIDRYNEVNNCWETIDIVPEPRLFATYTLVNDKVYIIGGWIQGSYQNKAKSVQVYSLEEKEWKDQELPNIKLWEHGSCTLYIPNN